MNTTATPRKPGPHPKGYQRQHIFIPPELAEWAKDHPDGMSGLIRRLLAKEREREEERRPRQGSFLPE